jgi:hypothetical protein
VPNPTSYTHRLQLPVINTPSRCVNALCSSSVSVWIFFQQVPVIRRYTHSLWNILLLSLKRRLCWPLGKFSGYSSFIEGWVPPEFSATQCNMPNTGKTREATISLVYFHTFMITVKVAPFPSWNGTIVYHPLYYIFSLASLPAFAVPQGSPPSAPIAADLNPPLLLPPHVLANALAQQLHQQQLQTQLQMQELQALPYFDAFTSQPTQSNTSSTDNVTSRDLASGDAAWVERWTRVCMCVCVFMGMCVFVGLFKRVGIRVCKCVYASVPKCL